jgi:hypothetical protein
MFFIRGMVTGKWICFYAVRKVTDNGSRLGFRRAKNAETEYKNKTKLNNK